MRKALLWPFCVVVTNHLRMDNMQVELCHSSRLEKCKVKMLQVQCLVNTCSPKLDCPDILGARNSRWA